jgi:Membrane bound beta barrel domain (DUF5777)
MRAHRALLALLLGAGLALPAHATDDFEPDPAEPDFTVVNLPTTLRLPEHALAFQLTHRFGRGLGGGSFGDLAGDFFGFDGGAQVGIGLRFAPFSGSQLAVYRTSDKTLELSLSQSLLQERSGKPLSLALVAGVEGLDNFGQDYSPSVALVISKRLGSKSALYAVPRFVSNTNILPQDAGLANDTLVLGLGARIGLRAGVALVGEASPRLAGYAGGANGAMHLTFGLEKQVGGHAFQINVSNDLGTTPAQVARGRTGRDDWFIGFNLSRKFY